MTIHDLMDIGLCSAVIDAKTTSDAWRDWSNAYLKPMLIF